MKPEPETTRIIRENIDLPKEELLQKLHASGFTSQTAKTVQQTRYRLKVKAAAKHKRSRPMGSKGGQPRAGSATSFVVSLPSTLTHAEAFERTRAAGYEVTLEAVYAARRTYKKLLRPEGRGPQSSNGHTSAREPKTDALARVDEVSAAIQRKRRRLAAAVMECGLDLARSVMTEFEQLFGTFEPEGQPDER